MSGTSVVKAHVRLAPSSAHRWIPCGASLRYDKPQDSNVYAEEGTAAHALAELALTRDADCDLWLGLKVPSGEGREWEVSEDMAQHTQEYVEFCRSLMAERGKWWVERKIDLAPLDPPEAMRGTSDFIAYDPFSRTLDVVDLKYGRGIVVEVDWNPQELYYALGAVLSVQAEFGLEIETVRISIVQPRAAHAAGRVRTFEIGIAALLEWAQTLLAAARTALLPDAPAVPGEWCHFCPGAAVCPALARQALEQVGLDFEVLDDGPQSTAVQVAVKNKQLPVPEQLTREQLSRALTVAPMIEGWIKAIEAHALALGMAGDSLPGFKVVEKRATRRWVGDAEAQLLARGVEPAALYEPGEMRSPAQLEKQLKKKEFKEVAADLCPAISSGFTLAPDTDVREAKAVGPGADFDVL